MRKKSFKMTMIGILSAFAFILYFFEVSVGFLFPSAAFLTVDFSDVPAIISTLIFSPIAGTTVELIKNILHFLFLHKDPGISGELANFLAGVAYLWPVWWANKSGFKTKRLIIGMVFGAILSTLVMIPVNYYVTMEIYGIPSQVRMGMILSTFSPYNIIKGIMLTVALVVIYPRLAKIIDNYMN